MSMVKIGDIDKSPLYYNHSMRAFIAGYCLGEVLSLPLSCTQYYSDKMSKDVYDGTVLVLMSNHSKGVDFLKGHVVGIVHQYCYMIDCL